MVNLSESTQTKITEHKTVLVTGGAGYIGSHTVLELLEQGYDVVVVDNLCNSQIESLNRVQEITKRQLFFYEASINDADRLHAIFQQHTIDAVIHFAGLKAVKESISQPLEYYKTNVEGTRTLLEVMVHHGCNNIVFSSSATVYGNVDSPTIKEDHPVGPINPYGQTKLTAEYLIHDVCTAHPNFNAALLRYFNPIGAHASGLIGEDPTSPPNNLLPCVTRAMIHRDQPLRVFGTSYNTRDGTAVRDFIHVVDLAQGHLAALRKLFKGAPGCVVYNMGNGRGYSVKEIISKMENVTGVSVPRIDADPRPGDAVSVIADPSLAFEQLQWQPKLGVDEMCRSAWKWQSQNPQGYRLKGKDMPKNYNFDHINTFLPSPPAINAPKEE